MTSESARAGETGATGFAGPHVFQVVLANAADGDAGPATAKPAASLVAQAQRKPAGAPSGAATGGRASLPDANTDWIDYVERQKPSAQAIGELAAALSEAGRHNDVVGLLEAALIDGRARPWMYEVLALSMELAGRPKADVERALLSSVDLAPMDSASLCYLGTYLARFNRHEQAFKVLGQAARLEPTRADPYILALKLADQLPSDANIAWAAPGVIATAWGSDRKPMCELAERAAANAISRFQQAGDSASAELLENAMANSRRVDLKVRVEWSGEGDIDLAVVEPGGTICESANKRTSAGGVFVRDGRGPKAANCFEEYVCPQAYSGEYTLKIRHILGAIVGKRVVVKVTRHDGTGMAETQTQTVSLDEPEVTLKVKLTHGRRMALARIDGTVPVRKRPATAPLYTQLPRPALNAQLGGGAGGGFAAGASRPFVQGIGPAAQPIIGTAFSGATVTGVPIVSDDRRYVRISLNARFTDVVDFVNFTFAR